METHTSSSFRQYLTCNKSCALPVHHLGSQPTHDKFVNHCVIDREHEQQTYCYSKYETQMSANKFSGKNKGDSAETGSIERLAGHCRRDATVLLLTVSCESRQQTVFVLVFSEVFCCIQERRVWNGDGEMSNTLSVEGFRDGGRVIQGCSKDVSPESQTLRENTNHGSLVDLRLTNKSKIYSLLQDTRTACRSDALPALLKLVLVSSCCCPVQHDSLGLSAGSRRDMKLKTDDVTRLFMSQSRARYTVSSRFRRTFVSLWDDKLIHHRLCLTVTFHCLATNEQTANEQTTNEQTNSEQTTNEQTTNEQTNSEQTTNEQTTIEQTNNEQTTNEQTTNEQTTMTSAPHHKSRRKHLRLKLAKFLLLTQMVSEYSLPSDDRRFQHTMSSKPRMSERHRQPEVTNMSRDQGYPNSPRQLLPASRPVSANMIEMASQHPQLAPKRTDSAPSKLSSKENVSEGNDLRKITCSKMFHKVSEKTKQDDVLATYSSLKLHKSNKELVNDVLYRKKESFRFNPYGFVPGSIYTNLQVNMLPQPVHGISWRLYERETMRLASFSYYPTSAVKSATLLAASGFVYIGNGVNDRVKCFFCSAEKESWLERDNIDQVHMTLSPNCPMVIVQTTNNAVSTNTTHNLNAIADYSSAVPCSDSTPLSRTANLTISSASEGQTIRDTAQANSFNRYAEFAFTSSGNRATSVDARRGPEVRSFDRSDSGMQSESSDEASNAGRSSSTHAAVTRPNNESNQDALRRDTNSASNQDALRRDTNSASNQDALRRDTNSASNQDAHRRDTNSASNQDALRRDTNSASNQDALRRDTNSASNQDALRRDTNSASNQDQQLSSSLEYMHLPAHHNINSQIYSIPTGAGSPPAPDTTTNTPVVPESTSSTANPDPQLTYQLLGIYHERPKHIQFAVLARRLQTFEGWPEGHPLKKEDLAKSGLFYAGYGDCCRCFFCGGGLRNWEDEDDPLVEHARWFGKCSFLRQHVGEDFVKAVQAVGAHRDSIKLRDVAEYMKQAGQTEYNSTDRNIAADAAVKSMTQAGYDPLLVERTAKNIVDSGEVLSADVILRVLREQGHEPNLAAAAVLADVASGGEITPNEDRLQALKEQNYALRNNLICKICMDKEVRIVFLPCGHLVCCQDCAVALLDCPLCRRHIRATTMAYIHS